MDPDLIIGILIHRLRLCELPYIKLSTSPENFLDWCPLGSGDRPFPLEPRPLVVAVFSFSSCAGGGLRLMLWSTCVLTIIRASSAFLCSNNIPISFWSIVSMIRVKLYLLIGKHQKIGLHPKIFRKFRPVPRSYIPSFGPFFSQNSNVVLPNPARLFELLLPQKKFTKWSGTH